MHVSPKSVVGRADRPIVSDPPVKRPRASSEQSDLSIADIKITLNESLIQLTASLMDFLVDDGFSIA